jgi:hypothetical protein
MFDAARIVPIFTMELNESKKTQISRCRDLETLPPSVEAKP